MTFIVIKRFEILFVRPPIGSMPRHFVFDAFDAGPGVS